MAEIEVRRTGGEELVPRFHVTVTEEDGATEHQVTVSLADFERLAVHLRSLEEFVRACFEFLLEREPKESILPSFDVSAISTYFPEFEEEIRQATPF